MFRLSLLAVLLAAPAFAQEKEKKYLDPIRTEVPHLSTDKSVKYDFDIVYVRARRAGDKVHKRFFTDFSSPVTMEPGADLMLLHPDGTEEVLVEGGAGSVTDPFVSFDGQWVYYVHIHNLQKANQWSPPKEGADIYKIHVKSRKVVRLTNQKFSPNTGAANWSSDYRKPEPGKSHFEYGVYNMGPCPLPGGRMVFTSNRDGFKPAKGYPAIALQLFVMDDRDTSIGDDETPTNLDKIGHLNLSGALHPVVLKDGRIMYSSLESQGARGDILWGIWTIHLDGTNWNPLVSAFDPGGAPNGFHFQTQLSDGHIIVEEYYNQNNSGPYMYPFRPYASWFHPMIYYPGAYMFPTPIGYPLVLAPVVEEPMPKKDTKPVEKIAANPVSLQTDLLKGKSKGDAPLLYMMGLEEYRDGRYAKAETYLEAATVLDDGDPRYWYYLALSRWMAGETVAGDEAAKYGAAVQVAQQFDRSIVSRSLESVQGKLRYRLEEAMLATDRAKATAFLAAKRPRPTGEATASAR